MRVIAGSLRGRRLQAPPQRTTRPTPDRVREALFSALESSLGGPGALQGARVADLFAGTGALGIEALSRGALAAVFVERDAHALETLRGNLGALGIEERARVVPGTAERFLERARGERFEVVFLDPPYGATAATESLRRIEEGDLLSDGGVVVVEHAAQSPPEAPSWRICFRRDYGSVGLTFLVRGGEVTKEEA